MAEGREAPRSRKSQPLYALLGVAIGLAAAAGALRASSRTKAPPPPAPSVKLAGGVLREDAGSLEEILVHYVPRLEPLVADAYADFLGTLDPGTRLVVVLPKAEADGGESPQEQLAGMLARIDPSGGLGARMRAVEVDGPISVWSKDRALVLGP